MARAKKLTDLRKKDADELRKALNEHRQEIMDLRFAHATGALENPSRLGLVKREVARILTVLNERQLAGTDTPTESAAPVAAGAGRE
jgi:large subunit ribosomal protein L29